VTRLGILTITPDREIGLVRQRRQQGEETLGRRLLHLAAIALDEGVPALGGERLREREFDEVRARREIR
jgi:hypothetical protein